jgi:hypothetical protein
MIEIDKHGHVHLDLAPSSLSDAGFEIGDMVTLRFGDNMCVVPYVRNNGEVDVGKSVLRSSDGEILLAVHYGSFADKYRVTTGMAISLSLWEKGGYRSELEIRNLYRTDIRVDYESDAVFANFRVVLVGDIAPNTLFRSCHPAADDARALYANVLAESVGIKTVLNLSDSDEELVISYRYSDFYRSLGEAGQIINLNMSSDILNTEFTRKLREAFLFMIDNNPPYLIHCASGKDRTGIVCALLEALMNAEAEEIYRDYILSFENHFHVKPGTPAHDIIRRLIVDIFTCLNDGEPVDNSNIRWAALKYLRLKVGLSLEEIENLKAVLK